MHEPTDVQRANYHYCESNSDDRRPCRVGPCKRQGIFNRVGIEVKKQVVDACQYQYPFCDVHHYGQHHSLTSFTGCKSRTLMSFLTRRQTDRITLIFGGCASMPNYFVAMFTLG